MKKEQMEGCFIEENEETKKEKRLIEGGESSD
jgi:hypothetical protein